MSDEFTSSGTIGSPPLVDIDSTWGGSAAQSYVSYDYADSFLSGGNVTDFSAWSDASTVSRYGSLVEATRAIDNRQYVGNRYSSQQRLEFPRQLTGRAWPYSLAVGYSATNEQQKMQDAVQRATCLQALWILRNGGRNDFSEDIANGIKRRYEQAGSVIESFDYQSRQDSICAEAIGVLRNYLESRRIYRG